MTALKGGYHFFNWGTTLRFSLAPKTAYEPSKFPLPPHKQRAENFRDKAQLTLVYNANATTMFEHNKTLFGPATAGADAEAKKRKLEEVVATKLQVGEGAF